MYYLAIWLLTKAPLFAGFATIDAVGSSWAVHQGCFRDVFVLLVAAGFAGVSWVFV
jgi:hypothetical protein